MPRAIWSGAISFGLVNIPVEVFPAIRDTAIHFHQLHKTDMGRVKYKKVCSLDGQELGSDDIVRGYETGRDEYVIVEDEELTKLDPARSETIEIHDFVDLSSIDPIYFDRPYYLVPERNGAKAYHLLRKAMEEAGKIAIASFIMRQRGYLVAIRPLESALLLETLHFSPQVVTIEELGGLGAGADVASKELKLAQQLIGSLTGAFEPERYHNEYEEKVRSLVESKTNGEEVTTDAPVVRQKQKVLDLKAALEQSLKAAAEGRKSAKALPAKTTQAVTATKKPAAKSATVKSAAVAKKTATKTATKKPVAGKPAAKKTATKSAAKAKR